MATATAIKVAPEQRRAEQHVQREQAKFDQALADARKAAETTQTEAWLANYKAAEKTHLAVRDDVRKTLIQISDILATRDLLDSELKQLGDAKKTLVEEEAAYNGWKFRTVYPVKSTAERCIGIREKLLAEAESAERGSPLTHRGFAAEVKAILATWADVEWDDEDGCVMVRDAK